MASREDPGSGVLLGGRAIDRLGASFFSHTFFCCESSLGSTNQINQINQIKSKRVRNRASFCLGVGEPACEVGRWMLARGWVRKAGTAVLSERDTSVAGS